MLQRQERIARVVVVCWFFSYKLRQKKETVERRIIHVSGCLSCYLWYNVEQKNVAVDIEQIKECLRV
jgi:hypothetical protein